MTNETYLEKYGWKQVTDGWQSPYTKQAYSEGAAMEVEFMLKGRAYVLSKMEIPESFEQGIADVEAGRTMDLDEALDQETS